MIDALEVSVPAKVPLNLSLREFIRALRPKSDPYYKARFDLQELGIDALLYRSCRYNGNHRVQIVRTGNKSFRVISAILAQVLDCDLRSLRVVRLDLAADVRGVSVRWFREHMYVPGKRRIRVYVKHEGESSCDWDNGCTIYLGAAQDLIRVYDKAAELKNKSHDSAPEDRLPLTRVERQLRGNRIPPELRTLPDIATNVVSFDPFKSVVILPGGAPEPTIEDYSLHRFLEGTDFRELVRKLGLQQVWTSMGRYSGGNGRRTVRRVADFVPPDPPTFQPPDLFAIYSQSICEQFAEGRSTHRANRSEIRSY